jgi:sigma-E factor negative regulatory protein RseA
MKEHVSALIDAEIGDESLARVLAALREQPELQNDWDIYHLIGEALQEPDLLAVDIAGRVSTRLRNEPTVLAPKPTVIKRVFPPKQWLPYAAAASVVALAVLGWQQFTVSTQITPAANNVIAHQVAPLVGVQAVNYSSNNPYLEAHRNAVGDPVAAQELDIIRLNPKDKK